MITINDLDEAIAELQGRRSPTSTDCIKLAAYYTIRDNLTPEKPAETPLYSRTEPEGIITYTFKNKALNDGLNGRSVDYACWLIDELMTTCAVVDKKLYAFIEQKLKE